MTTTVVHLKRQGGREVVGCDVYIGRSMNQGGWRLPTSIWANPFKLSEHSREEVLRLYEEYVRKKPELMGRLHELRGKRLGCWCAPLPCHGDVLVKLLGEIDDKKTAIDDKKTAIEDNDPYWSELGL
jgi:hypothetical protein